MQVKVSRQADMRWEDSDHPLGVIRLAFPTGVEGRRRLPSDESTAWPAARVLGVAGHDGWGEGAPRRHRGVLRDRLHRRSRPDLGAHAGDARDADQIVPYAASAPLSAQLLANATGPAVTSREGHLALCSASRIDAAASRRLFGSASRTQWIVDVFIRDGR